MVQRQGVNNASKQTFLLYLSVLIVQWEQTTYNVS